MPAARQTIPLARAPLAAHVERMKHRLHTATYEICLARARHFTDVYRETEGRPAAMRNALALQRTLEQQRIFIYADELLAGSKTERFLSTPLSVDRGDFLRVLQLELDVLEHKQKPFYISPDDRQLFWNEILPYWNGRTLHDAKAARWVEAGIVRTKPTLRERVRGWRDTVRFARYVGVDNLRKIAGANARAPLTWRRARNLLSLRFELAYTQPTPAVYCMDVQGHLCLGVDRVIELGMEELIRRATDRLVQLRREQPGNRDGAAFLRAVITSLTAAIAYAERFAKSAETMAADAADAAERDRLNAIAQHCRRVPRHRPRTFHEALQAAWMTLVVGEIQFGTMDVFGVGRLDQFLLPFYQRDLADGLITEAQAMALLQEYFIKLSANVSPTPELGMESNAVLGNSQHCVTIGGLTPAGADGTNALSFLILDAYEQMRGAVNQLCVRLHPTAPREFARRATAVFRTNNGIAFYNDEVIVAGMHDDGYTIEDARDYTIIGCVETCGHSNTQGCVAGHDFVLPAALVLTVTNGAYPPPSPGQGAGFASGDPAKLHSFEDLMYALERQLAHQVDTLIRAIAAKDLAHREMLPAPYVSALVDGCIESATDITAGGAKYDFTSIDVRGIGTLVDSLLAIRHFVFDKRELSLTRLIETMLDDFRDQEVLRLRLTREPPKYGTGDKSADALALRIIAMMHGLTHERRNVRGGKYRLAYFSLGNHVIDGILLGATPDGRRRGEPISNGISPSNLSEPPDGPQTIMRSVAKFPAAQVSSGVALNMRFHPNFIARPRGLETFVATLETYFAQGGMHLQPNFISVETLRDAQQNPDRYRDLVVKVSGYSASFTDLGKSIQDDIIARPEFGGPG